MLRRLLVPLLAAWAALTILCPVAGAEPVFPPGLRVGLEPLGDLKLKVGGEGPGFEDAARKVSITILELPSGGVYENIERSAFAENQRGLTGVKRESFPFASGVGFLMTGQAQEDGATVHRWFLLANSVAGGSQRLAVLINVGVADAARSVYTDALIRNALASVTFRPPPIEEQLGMLPFKIGELAGFRVMQALAAGVVILTDGPADDLSSQPYMIVSVGRGAPEDIGQRGPFARELLASAPMRDLVVKSEEAMRVGGAPGYEIRAQATGLRGEPVTLVQWVRFGGNGFLRVVGVGNNAAWDDLFTRFRAVRDGVDLR
jgi:hypothetical protein